MYAKLVVGSSGIDAMRCIRDIARLLTSDAPTTDLLESFDDVSSIVVDSTPAGWSFAGESYRTEASVADIGDAITWPSNNTDWQLALTAPCLNDARPSKVAVFSMSWLQSSQKTTGAGRYFQLSGAVSVSAAADTSSNIVIENQGGRDYWVAAESATQAEGRSITTTLGTVLHLIATPRHITIIDEGRGISAIWESSEAAVNTFYDTAPFVQYNQTSGSTGLINSTAVTSQPSVPTNGVRVNTFAITDPNDGNYYGVTSLLSSDANKGFGMAQTEAAVRSNTIDENGSPKYQVTPVFYTAGHYGHPVQFITGIVPIYWTKGAIGTTGDTIDVAGDSYTFFNCGSNFGVVMQTD